MRVALVVGGARCLFDDLDAALDMGEFDGVVGCNHAGLYWRGRMDGWASLHGDLLTEQWAPMRRRMGLEAHKALFPIRSTPHRFGSQTEPGSSGLFALKVALDDLGFDRAVLCGVPISIEEAHFDYAGPWRAASSYCEGWRQSLPHIADRARSMSGFTRDLLGAPTPEWIMGD